MIQGSQSCFSALSGVSRRDASDWRCFLARHSVYERVGWSSFMFKMQQWIILNESFMSFAWRCSSSMNSHYPSMSLSNQPLAVWMREQYYMSKTCLRNVSLRNKKIKKKQNTEINICDLTLLSCKLKRINTCFTCILTHLKLELDI